MAVEVPDGEGLVDIAREAYAFFFPMLMGYRFLFGVNLAPGLPSYVAPVNTLDGRPETVDHTSEDVITPNSDTPYSIANLDLRTEPMVLSVPEITDRFYHFQLVDLWGHNAHYIGVNTTGTGSGSYLLAGPGWNGEAPEEIDEVFRFETNVVFMIGRTQLFGPDDVEKLGDIISSYSLRPLSVHLGEQHRRRSHMSGRCGTTVRPATNASSAMRTLSSRCVSHSILRICHIWTALPQLGLVLANHSMSRP
jgi:hypothetical protein